MQGVLMIRDTYRDYEINIKREKCTDGSSFLSYTIQRVSDFVKIQSGLEFSGCSMPNLMQALKYIVDGVIADKTLDDEFEIDEPEDFEHMSRGYCGDCGDSLPECKCE